MTRKVPGDSIDKDLSFIIVMYLGYTMMIGVGAHRDKFHAYNPLKMMGYTLTGGGLAIFLVTFFFSVVLGRLGCGTDKYCVFQYNPIGSTLDPVGKIAVFAGFVVTLLGELQVFLVKHSAGSSGDGNADENL